MGTTTSRSRALFTWCSACGAACLERAKEQLLTACSRSTVSRLYSILVWAEPELASNREDAWALPRRPYSGKFTLEHTDHCDWSRTEFPYRHRNESPLYRVGFST